MLSDDAVALDLAALYPPLGRYAPNVATVSVPQALFLLLDCREAFYGGAAGGGKSDALLMAALQYMDVPGYAALLLRRTYVELSKADSLIPRSHEWLAGTDARWNEQRKTWTFPSGATLEFGHVETEADRHKYQSAAYAFIGFDELTSFTESQYEYIAFSRQRRRKALAEIGVPIRVRSASNPGGVGHGWVSRRFITQRKPSVVFVPARVQDNPGLDVDDYIASLSQLSDTLRRQLLEGDWNAAEGLAFDYRDELHSVPAFRPPDEWDRWESLDHGTTNPACLLAWAIDPDGNHVIFDSYYSPGLPSQHARAITAKRAWWWPRDERGWARHGVVCYADPEMWATKGETKLGDPASDITEFHELGIVGLAKANNRRRAGRLRLAELLRPDPERYFPRWHRRYGEKGAPQLFVVAERCPELVEQLKTAPLMPLDAGHQDAGEIIDPGWERQHGHATASARYGAMARMPATELDEAVDPRCDRCDHPSSWHDGDGGACTAGCACLRFVQDARMRAVRVMVELEREAEEWEDGDGGFWA
jgi:hypothetical protein